MSNKKQTAVEWLEVKVNAMIENGGDADLLAVIEHIKQAKEMERQYIMQSLNDGKAMALGNLENKSLEQYYKVNYEQ